MEHFQVQYDIASQGTQVCWPLQVFKKGLLSQTSGWAIFIAREVQMSEMCSHARGCRVYNAKQCPIFRKYLHDLRDSIRWISQFVCRT